MRVAYIQIHMTRVQATRISTGVRNCVVVGIVISLVWRAG